MRLNEIIKHPLLDFSNEEQRQVIDYYLKQRKNSTEKDAWDYWKPRDTYEIVSLLRQLKILKAFEKRRKEGVR